MNILFATSEALPLVKTGGLADVSGSLPKALRELGHEVRLVLPAYADAVRRAGNLERLTEFDLAQGAATVLEGRVPGSDLVLYLIDAPWAFDREDGPYTRENGEDWPDNGERFALFARAIAAIAMGHLPTGWRPDIVHCNDWQTGLVPALLADLPRRPATVFTIHNLAYQGIFPRTTFDALALPASLWSLDKAEFYGQMSFLKAGIATADWITTVSPTYANEIRSEELGAGLDGLLRHRSARLVGILNGADYTIWDPARDPWIAHTYDSRAVQHRAPNKTALRDAFGLPQTPRNFLLGHIGRLVEQKGVDLILDILGELFELPVQLVILGNGDRVLDERLRQAAARHPRQMAVHIGYSEELAHRIEAGVDAFLMPSRFEPCGLNQLYSLRYGAIPIVRRTGGLADTVVDTTPATLDNCTATGFSFTDPTPRALHNTIRRALNCWQLDPVQWWKLVITGMRQDFSWTASARRYAELYERAATESEGASAA